MIRRARVGRAHRVSRNKPDAMTLDLCVRRSASSSRGKSHLSLDDEEFKRLLAARWSVKGIGEMKLSVCRVVIIANRR